MTFLDETYRAEALVSGNLKGKDAAAFDVLRQAVTKVRVGSQQELGKSWIRKRWHNLMSYELVEDSKMERS